MHFLWFAGYYSVFVGFVMMVMWLLFLVSGNVPGLRLHSDQQLKLLPTAGRICSLVRSLLDSRCNSAGGQAGRLFAA